MTKHNVTFQREEYTRALPRWELVDDCCAGSQAIKAKTVAYLPKPNPLDYSAEAEARYKDYLFRAVFFNATSRTLQGLDGLVFRKPPELEIPAALDYIKEDVDGCGVSIYQQSQLTLEGVLMSGRHGLMADYPQTNGAASVADMKRNGIRATIVAYPASAVVNWRTEKVGGLHRYSLIVIRECVEQVTEDGFGVDKIDQYRVLKMVGGVYVVELWQQAGDKKEWTVLASYSPLNAAGRTWAEIPFTFVGAQNNDASIDDAPMYDLAEINVAHYRNSAEYEDTTFMCGQVQPVASGVDQAWVEFLKEKGIQIGSRVLFPLPPGATFEFVQAEANTLPIEAMKHKEEQMIALGAQIITQGGQVRTATEAGNDNAMNTSVLSIAASNVSEAYTKCLGWLGEFMGATGKALYALNQDFTKYTLDPQLLTSLVALWQTGKWPEADLFSILRKYGLVNPEKDDETIREELSTQTQGLGLDDGTVEPAI